MRAVFGLIGLLVVLAIVAVLVKMQLKSVRFSLQAPTAEAVPASGADVVAPMPKQTSQRIADNIARAMDQGAHDCAAAAER